MFSWFQGLRGFRVECLPVFCLERLWGFRFGFGLGRRRGALRACAVVGEACET